MWTGTEILYENAQLLRMLIPKCMAAMTAHFFKGTRGLRSVYGPVEENCVGYEKRVVQTKWANVIRRPKVVLVEST